MAEKVCIADYYHQVPCLHNDVYSIIYQQLCALGGVPLLALRKEMSNTLPDEKVQYPHGVYICTCLRICCFGDDCTG